MEIVEARSEDRVLLWNINQKYLYEMTNYYDVEMDQSGILHYGFLTITSRIPKEEPSFCMTAKSSLDLRWYTHTQTQAAAQIT